MIAKLTHTRLHSEPANARLDWGVLFLLVAFGAISLFMSRNLFVAGLAALVIGTISLDRFTFYKSAINLLMPFVLLTIIGLLSGLQNTKHDYLRDVILFSRNIVFIVSGVALSRYIKNFAQFFRYFIIVAFFASLVHVAKIVMNIGEINSLQTIRIYAGFTNSLEGVTVAIYVSRLLSKKFRGVTGKLTFSQKLMLLFTTLSFFLYFSRTLIILLVVGSLFLCDSIYIRTIFSRKNRRLFFISIIFISLVVIGYLSSMMFSVNSPVRTLKEKFQNVPNEITWSRQRNLYASKEDIQNNWRGYEAYQGILKFDEGGTLEQIFGFGFGARVDLGLIMKLSGKDYEDVPILHNEYVMLLIKTGITGLLLYLLFLYTLGFRTLKRRDTEIPEIYYSYQMISALSIIILVNTYTGFGLLDPSNMAIPIFIGFFWGNIQRNKVRINLNQVISAGAQLFQASKYYR